MLGDYWQRHKIITKKEGDPFGSLFLCLVCLKLPVTFEDREVITVSVGDQSGPIRLVEPVVAHHALGGVWGDLDHVGLVATDDHQVPSSVFAGNNADMSLPAVRGSAPEDHYGALGGALKLG